jgi:molybdenum cofactor cytidylyltransferase
VVLAAGASQRMGMSKALLMVGGQTLLERVAQTARAAGSSELVVAIGPPHGQAVHQRFATLPVKWAWNAQPELGMLSSVQVALPLLPGATRGALIWPVDVPFVAVATVQRLLACDLEQPAVLVSGGRGGHPLWLPRQLFGAALDLQAQQGLRALRTAHPPQRIEVEDEEVLRDLDTPEDVERARSYWGG